MVKDTYKKGHSAELEYKEYLESKGYKVIIAPRGNRFSKQNDFFDEWDLIAYMPDNHWLVSQVKCNSTGGVLHKLQELSKELPKGTIAQLCIRFDNKRTFEERWDIRELR